MQLTPDDRARIESVGTSTSLPLASHDRRNISVLLVSGEPTDSVALKALLSSRDIHLTDEDKRGIPVDIPATPKPETPNSHEKKARPEILTKVETVINLKNIEDAFDQGEEKLLSDLGKLRKFLIAAAIDKIIDLSPAEYHTLTLDVPDAKLEPLRAELLRIYERGRQLIIDELEAQGASDLSDPGEADDEDDEWVDNMASMTGSRVANDVQNRVAGAALALVALGLGIHELHSRLTTQMADASTGYLRGAAATADHATLNRGRSAQIDENADIISSVIYSCVLDSASCDPCLEADGETGATEDDITDCPNPDCEGQGNCRCIKIAVLASEQ